jgi:hypothetical protein
MNKEFDELTKSMAQSVTRRQVLKRFGVGLAGMALACFGLTSTAAGATHRGYCRVGSSIFSNPVYTGVCVHPKRCISGTSTDCPAGALADPPYKLGCGSRVSSRPCSFTL